MLDVRGLSKRYPGVLALDDATLDVARGEVHALVGENGAGKSTLIKILSGAIRPDRGEIILEGQPVRFADPMRAQRAGIATIHQEGSLVPTMTVAENLFLGNEMARFALLRVPSRREMRARARDVLTDVGAAADPAARLASLPLDQRQLVEVARALLRSVRVLILDEPTSALSHEESERLFAVIERLSSSGVSVIYVTHRLAEVPRLADRVTVLRDGKIVGTVPAPGVDVRDLIRMMVGRDLPREAHEPRGGATGEEALRIAGLTRYGAFRDVSFFVGRGEIVGLAGLAGAGQSELLRAIYAAEPVDSGRVELFGTELRVDTPSQALRAGIGYMPADRQRDAILPGAQVRHNLSLTALDRISRLSVINRRAEGRLFSLFASKLRVKVPHGRVVMRVLSGGNQQKVVLGRALAAEARVFVFDEPTRGVDVGAKLEIYKLMRRLAEDGAGLLLYSSELPELVALSDRIYVMHAGRVVGELSAGEATEERITRLAFGEMDVEGVDASSN